MRYKIIMVWICILIPTAAVATELSSLKSAVKSALEHAPSLQAAQAARDAATEDITLGRAGLLPYVIAKGSISRINQDFTYDRTSLPLSTRVRNNERLYGVKAYQPLFDVEKWALFQQGKISAVTGELKLGMQRQQTILETAAAWLDVVRAQAALEAAKASELAMKRLAMQAKAAFEVGTAAANDSLSAGSRHDLAKAQRIQASQILEQAESQLNSLVGSDTAVSVDLKQGIKPIRAIPDKISEWEQRAEENAFAVQLSDQAVAMADAGHLHAVGGALPKLQLVAGWERNISSDGWFGGSTVRGASIGIEVTMPLYTGGSTWAEQRKTSKEKIRAEYNMIESRRMARLYAHQSLLGLRTSAAEIAAFDAAVRSAASEKKAAQAAFEVGVRTITEALDAEERLAITRQNYADAVARHAMSFLQLNASAGDLNELYISTIDGFLIDRE